MKKLKVIVGTSEKSIQDAIDTFMKDRNVIDVKLTANKYVICVAIIYEEVL